MDKEEFLKALHQLKKQLNLDYSYLIISDGSGTIGKTPCGFTSLIHDNIFNDIEEVSGSISNGTNMFAELMPFVTALWRLFDRNHIVSGESIVCVSDSEVTVKCGNKEYSRNNPLWGAIEKFEEKGVRIKWYWIARNSNPVHKYCDDRSRKLRKNMEEFLNGKDKS